MKVSYGPPGERGVTSLMAVGDDLDEGQADKAIHTGIVGAAIATIAGFLFEMPRVQTAGIGALLALGLVHRAARKPQMVKVTAPAPSGRW